jgi:hypothetical protein
MSTCMITALLASSVKAHCLARLKKAKVIAMELRLKVGSRSAAAASLATLFVLSSAAESG